LEVLREALRHATQLVLQLLAVGDVALEGLLVAVRDALRARLQRPGVDAACAVTEERAHLSRQEALELGVGESGQGADRLEPRRSQLCLRARADAGQETHVERGQE